MRARRQDFDRARGRLEAAKELSRRPCVESIRSPIPEVDVPQLSRIRFDEHARYHGTVVRLLTGGALGGLVAMAARWLAPWEWAYGLTLGLIALGVAAAFPWGRVRRAVLLAPVLAALGAGLLLATGAAHESFGLFLLGAVLGLPASGGLSRYRRALVLVGTGAGAMLGVPVARAIEQSALAALGAPELASFALEGGLVGFFVGLGTVGRHVSLRHDSLDEALGLASRELGSDFGELALRVRETRKRVLAALERREGASHEVLAVQKAVDGLAKGTVAVGRRWQRVEQELGGTGLADLDKRIATLDERSLSAADEEAGKAYERAKRALEDQREHHSEIARSRERTVARLHGTVATLERLHLAVVRLQSADAHRFAGELQPLLDDLDGVGTDAELAAQAMDESQKAPSTH
jgi:hypothetical protein